MDATNLTEVTDEQIEDRITELVGKEDRSEEETTELNEVKKERSGRYQKKITMMTSENKATKYELEKERERAADMEERLKELESAPKAEPVVVKTETVEIGGQKYYTDEALMSMVAAKQLNDNEAWKYQRNRDKAEMKAELREEFTATTKEEKDRQVREEDKNAVLSKYPQFDKKHPDFNENDPLYKEASRIYKSGYGYNPKGLSLAIKDAKRMLGITDKHIDATDDLNLHSPSAPLKPDDNKDVELDDTEKNAAYRMYVLGNIQNPKTGRPYTENEAIEKAKQAKLNRRK